MVEILVLSSPQAQVHNILREVEDREALVKQFTTMLTVLDVTRTSIATREDLLQTTPTRTIEMLT